MLVPSDNKVGYMVSKLRGVLVTLGVVYSGVVGALGLGELTLDSYLNEPFKANIELLLDAHATLAEADETPVTQT